ncbi:LysE family transporter [uncultured Nostoc sp.]|uniref:LysE family transporter n=1 Tax=uncultured Nostoc sp. TaxID=340711 RepID=UPI0035CC5FF1
MFSFILQGIILGFSAAIAPGGFQIYLFTESLARGWRSGLRVAVAPLLSDAPIILLVTLLLHHLPNTLLGLINLLGSALLLYLARTLLSQTKSGLVLLFNDDSHKRLNWSLWHGVLINVSSPGLYIFWGTVGGPLIVEAWKKSAVEATVFLVSFYGVFILLHVGLVFLAHQMRRLPLDLLSKLWLVNAGLLSVLALVLATKGLYMLLR